LGDFRVVSNVFGHSGHNREIRFSRFKLLKMADEIKAVGIEKFDGTNFGY